MLTTNNPEMPDSLVEFSFKERSFVMTLLPPHMITLLEMEGTCLHKDTQEAKDQMEQEGGWDGQFSFSRLKFLSEGLQKLLENYPSGGLEDLDSPLMPAGFLKKSQRRSDTVTFSELDTVVMMSAYHEVPRAETGVRISKERGRDNNSPVSQLCFQKGGPGLDP